MKMVIVQGMLGSRRTERNKQESVNITVSMNMLFRTCALLCCTHPITTTPSHSEYVILELVKLSSVVLSSSFNRKSHRPTSPYLNTPSQTPSPSCLITEMKH